MSPSRERSVNTLIHVMAAFLIGLSVNSLAFSQESSADPIPRQLWGKWRIVRELNTRTISCWGDKEAAAVVGTTITYSPDGLNWRNVRTRADKAKVRTITASQFEEENSGGGANDSRVDFGQLGIKSAVATQIAIDHPVVEITGATSEFPGDVVLVKSPDTLVFSLCNLYFEARRMTPHRK
jgi:hypothetical protein